MWRTIAVPTLLLWGESDARSPLSVAKAFHGGIPGSRLVTIPGGHVSNMQSPEAFNTAVIQFVCGVEAGGGTRSG
jgi:pimeloyl-ACP methyl ester carboxylesterase